MAKQRGVIQYTGKLGQTVGMKNPTGSTNYTREYLSDVSNPKTSAQAAQRMRMTPAVNFYRQLGYVINHAYQGTRYKAPSQRKFMSEALGDTTLVIPFMNKGDQRFVPGNYLISSGTLPGVAVTGITDPNNIATTLQADNIGTTIGSLCQDIYNNNAGFLYGDKLTFIWVVEGLDGQSGYQLFSAQLVLDENDTTSIADYLITNKITFQATSNQLVIKPNVGFNIEGDPVEIVAAAVVQSRVPATTGGDWQRSNSRFYLADSLLEKWMSAGRFNEALLSYQADGSNTNSDWYLNFGTYESRGVIGNNTTDSALFNIGTLTLPESGQNPAITLNNVAAITIGTTGTAIIYGAGTLDTNRRVYTKIRQNTIQQQDTVIPDFISRMQEAGYATIGTSSATALGIQIVTDEGGEDRP